MMRTDGQGRGGSPPTMDFQAIRCSFDRAPRGPGHVPRVADPAFNSNSGRGRVQCTRGNRIRENIFLQMDNQQGDVGGGSSAGSSPSQLSAQASPSSGSNRSPFSSHSNPRVFPQEHASRAEDIGDIDRVALAQKFSVTRKLFESKFAYIVIKGLSSKVKKEEESEEQMEQVSGDPGFFTEFSSGSSHSFQSSPRCTESQRGQDLDEYLQFEVATPDPSLTFGDAVGTTVEQGSPGSSESGEQQEDVVKSVEGLVDDGNDRDFDAMLNNVLKMLQKEGGDEDKPPTEECDWEREEQNRRSSEDERTTHGDASLNEGEKLLQEEDQEIFIQMEDGEMVLQEEYKELFLQEEDEEIFLQEEDKDLVLQEEDKDILLQEDGELVSQEEDGDIVLQEDDEEEVLQEEDKDIVLQEDDEEVVLQEEDEEVVLQEEDEEVVLQEEDEEVVLEDGVVEERHVNMDCSLATGNSVNYEEIPGLPKIAEEEKAKGRLVWFSSAPIKVFITYANEEYDRQNQDIDPMSASAEYELEKRVDKMDVFPLDIEKGDDAVGISIIGMGVGADQGMKKLGIFVKSIANGGVIDRDGRVRIHDQILEAEGVSLVGVTQAFAADVLKKSSGVIKLVIGRAKGKDLREVAQLINQSLEMEQTLNETEPAGAQTGAQAQAGAQALAVDDDLYFGDDEEDDFSTLNILDPNEMCVGYQRMWNKLKNRTSLLRETNAKLVELKGHLNGQVKENGDLRQKLKDEIDKCETLEKYWQDAETLCRALSQKLAEAQSHSGTLEFRYNKFQRIVWVHQSRGDQLLKTQKDLIKQLKEKDLLIKEMTEKLKEKESGAGAEPQPEPEEEIIECDLPVPDTGLLDSSAQIARAQLAQKSKRQPPSREKLRESCRMEQEVAEVIEEAPAPVAQKSAKKNRSSTSSVASRPLTPAVTTPEVFMDYNMSSTINSSSSSKKSKKKFPNFSGFRKSLSRSKSTKKSRRASSGDDVAQARGVSPTSSMTSSPSCLHFRWFGKEHGSDNEGNKAEGKKREKREGKKGRGNKLSSSSLPHLSASPKRDVSTGSLKDCSTMVHHLSDHSLYGHSYTLTFSSNETVEDDTVSTSTTTDNKWQNRPMLEWNSQQVSLWLYSINMEQYMATFTTQAVDGAQLLNMDSDFLKTLGVSAMDRSFLKKRLKEMKRNEDNMQKEKREKERQVFREMENDGNNVLNPPNDILEPEARCSVGAARAESFP